MRQALLPFALLLAAAFPADAALPTEAARLIQQAGNAGEERERLEALETLSAVAGLEPALRAEAKSLAGFVRRWNGSSLKFYFADLPQQSRRAIGDYPFGVAAESPLRPVADLYRGRMLAWTLIENSSVRTDPEDSRWFKDEAVASFRRVAEAFPQNRIPRMYLGERLPWGAVPAKVAGAPEWASLQREQIERLAAIIRWWIANRQRPDGQFGGGWGDDCEMWRWWAAVLLGFDDPEIAAAQLKFSKAAVSRTHLKGGFNTRVADVEHAAEDTTDNLVPLMLLEPDVEHWTRWGLRLGDFMREVWTGRNQRGQFQFRSFWFSATEVSQQPQRALDVIANVGALHPAMLAWRQTGDAKLGTQICAWLDTWVDATARAENGKPAGILPAAIRWPDGAVAGVAGNWWEPVKPGGFMHSYYVWPSVITEMTDALMLAHVMTGRESYLAPLRSLAAVRLESLRNPPAASPQPGTEAWCGEQLAPRANANSNTGGLVKSLARFQALTGTAEFDQLLSLEGPEFVIRNDAPVRRELEAALRESLAALRVNFPGFTSEVRSTDRVMRFVQFLARDYAFDEYRGATQPKHELLYRMVTGDKNAPRFPQMAVRWKTPPQDIAVLVSAASRTRFEAELFHFGIQPRPVTAELRLLQPGRYSVQLQVAGQQATALPELVLNNGRCGLVRFDLPARELATLVLNLQETRHQ